MQLVPAVRERMLRIRFLTAMAVGSLVIEDLEGNPSHRDATPYLVWEWLVVEALTREPENDPVNWGVPGSAVTRTARAQHGYVDARSYLKTPRVFGFHQEERLHADLERRVPAYGALVQAIRNYEAFARGLQDAFDVLRAKAAAPDARGFVVPHVARNEAFRVSVDRLDERFAAARCLPILRRG